MSMKLEVSLNEVSRGQTVETPGPKVTCSSWPSILLNPNSVVVHHVLITSISACCQNGTNLF